MDDVERSIQHYTALPSKIKDIVNSYTHEIDADDWNGSPLPLSYQLMNFVLKQRHSKKKDLAYMPELLVEQVLSKEDIRTQVNNAKLLKCIIDGFPLTTRTHTVYRGFLCNDYYFQESDKLRRGTDFTVPYFLSTSIYPEIALRFTRNGSGCIWHINIPSNTPLAFIRDSVNNCNECEVVLNIGAVLRLQNKTTDEYGNKHLQFDLIGYSKYAETRGFWPLVYRVASSYVCPAS